MTAPASSRYHVSTMPAPLPFAALQENERLFNIPVERLLTVDGRRRTPQDVYRKIAPIELSVLK